MNGKAILVTGGAGYIGSHACEALARAGYLPVTFDNLSTGHKESVRWGPLEVGDITDTSRLGAVIERHRPASVMHFAASAYVAESVLNPAKYYRNNVFGTSCVLERVVAHRIPYVVFSSSCATYGVPADPQVRETTEQRPVSPYGFTKLVCEKMIMDFGRVYGFNSVILRYFNAAGAHPLAGIGESHDPETHLIPLVLNTALGMQDEVRIFGADYDTPDGSCIRDYVHVSDLADAHVLASNYLMSHGKSDVFNLGNEKGYSVVEVIAAARRVTGRVIRQMVLPRREGDVAALYADATKAKSILGWDPNYPEIERIVEHAWAWHLTKSY